MFWKNLLLFFSSSRGYYFFKSPIVVSIAADSILCGGWVGDGVPYGLRFPTV